MEIGQLGIHCVPSWQLFSPHTHENKKLVLVVKIVNENKTMRTTLIWDLFVGSNEVYIQLFRFVSAE